MNNLVINRIKGWLAIYLIGVSALIVPVYIRYGYLHLIEEKASLYLHLSVPALLSAAIVFAVSAVFSVKKEGISSLCRAPGGIRGRFFVILTSIAAWSLISSSLAADRKASFLGTMGWSMGSLTLCVLICSTICIAAWFPFPRGDVFEDSSGRGVNVCSDAGARKSEAARGVFTHVCERKSMAASMKESGLPKCFMIPAVAVHALIFLFAIIQASGRDPFAFLSMIDHHYYYSYLSTIGQKNCFSGYLCLLLPVFFGLFMQSEDRLYTAIYGLFSAMGLFCAAVADSDSLYAGFGICVFFMISFALAGRQRAVRASILLFIFGICLLAAGYLPFFADRVSNMQGISAAILGFPGAGCVLLAGGLLYLFSVRWMGDPDGKAVRILVFLIRAAVAAVIIAALLWGITHFSDSMGTNRGLIWRVGWEKFCKASVRQKLVGTGPEMLAVLYAELRISPGINVLSAHCEPLHILLTQGLIGLGLYLVFWGHMFLLWKENCGPEEDGNSIWFFPLAAYLGHSLFCPLYPVTAALFSAFSGLFLHFCKGTGRR